MLAAICTSHTEALQSVQEHELRGSHFYDMSLGRAFDAAMRLADRGRTPDISAILDEATRHVIDRDHARDELLTAMADVAGQPGTAADLGFFCERIKGMWARRELARESREHANRLEGLQPDESPVSEIACHRRVLLDIEDVLEVGSGTPGLFRGEDELVAATQEEVPWVAEPAVAKGEASLVCGPPKVGKSTWLYGVLADIERGTRSCSGLEIHTSSKTVILSEEPPVLVLEKMRAFGLHPSVLTRDKRRPGWTFRDYLRASEREARRIGAQVIVVDTFSAFAALPAGGLYDAAVVGPLMQEVLDLAGRGYAVVVVHHERKNSADQGIDAVAGSYDITGKVDLIAQVRKDTKLGENERELTITGRHADLPTEPIVIALEDDRFVPVGEGPQVRKDRKLEKAKEAVLGVLVGSDTLKRDEILERAGVRAFDAKKAIRELVQEGRIEELGEGKQGDPYRYRRAPLVRLGPAWSGPTSGSGSQGDTGPYRDPTPGTNHFPKRNMSHEDSDPDQDPGHQGKLPLGTETPGEIQADFDSDLPPTDGTSGQEEE